MEGEGLSTGIRISHTHLSHPYGRGRPQYRYMFIPYTSRIPMEGEGHSTDIRISYTHLSSTWNGEGRSTGIRTCFAPLLP